VLAVLCLLPLYLSPHAARVVAAVLIGLVIVVAILAATGFRRLLDRFVSGDDIVLGGGRLRIAVPTLGRPVRAVEGVAAILRRAGIALPALLFFCGWALVYMLIWAHSPEACSLDLSKPCSGAFQGPATIPRSATSSTSPPTWPSPTPPRISSPTAAWRTPRPPSRS